MPKKTIYIAGPITGVERYWEPFEKADDDLTSRGYAVLNPSRLPQGMQAVNYTDICWMMLGNADAVLMLPGWEDSMGAAAERRLASMTNKPVYYSIEEMVKGVPAR